MSILFDPMKIENMDLKKRQRPERIIRGSSKSAFRTAFQVDLSPKGGRLECVQAKMDKTG
ncbi:MAG: hypothetical protein QF466_11595 [Desulfobacterales bacterium]|jgi:hypothetical protein|nr:hypothetical protein [Desulfobacter sp.]MDP6396066.1 hypothetical protein [Desulfobacterales bacterium]MDP6682844.1 hypothetical protein [Desulfobacterales bacterium]MDP6807823.1 hypothetical protein [Desulfobacterales bacterium]|tara:strand:- start:12491 stop:12670 length:180 start_codon:yes stop_codon:yes gene_type:complete